MMTFKISDMTCGHCAGLINRSVKAIDPGCRTAFDLERRTLSVASTRAGIDEVLNAIAEAGYTATPSEA